MIIIEPTVSKYQHVAFLAAYILAVKSACGDEVVEFWSNSQKNSEIEKYISLHSGQKCSVVFRDMYNSRDPESISRLRRQLSLIAACIKCFWGRGSKHSAVVFGSTHWPMVFYAFLIKKMSVSRKKSVMIVHDSTSLIRNDKMLKPLLRLEKLNNCIVVLSRDIADLTEKSLRGRLRVDHINLPCIWAEDTIDENLSFEPVRFGFIGDSKKGLEIFYDIAKQITVEFPQVEFHVIGRSKKNEVDRYGDVLQGLNDEYLSDQEYSERIRNQTYLIFPYSDSRYNYRASATLVDALSFLKPGIYLDNLYVSECFRILGDIGYICISAEDIISEIKAILVRRDRDDYRIKTENIRSNRTKFGVDYVGKQLKGIFSTEI